MNESIGVDSQTLLYVRSHPAGAFCFQKIHIPGILGHARFASSCVLQFFAVFGPLMRPLVTKNTIIKFASVTDYKIYFCVVKPNPL